MGDQRAPHWQDQWVFFMRSRFYIDGFNVYGAICDMVRRGHCDESLKWLSYKTLCDFLAANPNRVKPVNGTPGQLQKSTVDQIFFYTAIPASHRTARHLEFVNASVAQGVTVVEGAFKRKEIECKLCSRIFEKKEEKESDVNLAVGLVSDAIRDQMDIAYVFTMDSDIAPAFRQVREHSNVKIVTVAVQPRPHSIELLDAAHYQLYLNEQHLVRNLLPAEIYDATGQKRASRPSKYKPKP